MARRRDHNGAYASSLRNIERRANLDPCAGSTGNRKLSSVKRAGVIG